MYWLIPYSVLLEQQAWQSPCPLSESHRSHGLHNICASQFSVMIRPHAGPMKVDRNCFNIESEIEYWKINRGALDTECANLTDDLLVSLVKFAYDGYILHGKVDFLKAETFLLDRFSNAQVRHHCQWRIAGYVCRAIWKRLTTCDASNR